MHWEATKNPSIEGWQTRLLAFAATHTAARWCAKASLSYIGFEAVRPLATFRPVAIAVPLLD